MSHQNDLVLGQEVNKHLIDLGIETPVVETGLTPQEKIQKLTEEYSRIHQEILGLDLSDDSLAETPKRVAKLQINEALSGLDYNNFPKMTTVINKFYDGMVSVNDILVNSMCEHHHLPIVQRVSISYIPSKGGKVLGLSKLARLAEFFGDRPIVQERYTAQVFESLKFILGLEDVAIHVRGIHMCMFARGVEEPCSSTTTTLLGGKYKTDSDLRNEFLNGIDITKPIFPH